MHDLVALDPTTAVLVRGGRITDVRPRAALPASRTLEADRVTAGFVDAHAHPSGLGQLLSELDVGSAPTYQDALARIAAAPGDGWLVGRGWDQNAWPDAPEGGWPLASDLERVCPGRPIALRRVDGHALWVSPAALERSGIHAGTADPPGGRFLRDADGAPSGVAVDAAMHRVRLPPPTPAEREAQVLAGLRAAADAGLTGVHEMGIDDDTLAVYQRLDADGALPVRLWVYLLTDTDAAARLLSDGPWRGDRLHVVGLKAFADGALGSRGAHLGCDYCDDPGNRGLVLADPDALADLATRALSVRAQLAVHAIGDAAVHDVLDAFEVARANRPDARDVPLRVEHAQIVRPDDVPRFAALNVVASVQPAHCTSDMPWIRRRLGDRVRWASTWRSLRDAGAHLALGSDFPVEPVDPGRGVWAATTRTDARGHPAGGWFPEERLTLDEAVAGFTAWPAAAVRAADVGRLAPGFHADLTCWRTRPGPGGAPLWTPTAAVVGGVVREVR